MNAGTMDTHPPDTYFGIEVEPLQQRDTLGWFHRSMHWSQSLNCEICSFSGFAAPNGRRSWDLRQRRTGKSKYRKDEKHRKGLGSQVLQREFCAGEVSEEKNTIDAPCCNRSDETESKSARPSCLNTLALGKKTSLTEVSPWAQGVLKDSRACRKDWKCSTWLRVCLCQRSVE